MLYCVPCHREISPRMPIGLTEAAAHVGLEFHLDKITRTPNTVNAHRLIRFAGQKGVGLFESRLYNSTTITPETPHDETLMKWRDSSRAFVVGLGACPFRP